MVFDSDGDRFGVLSEPRGQKFGRNNEVIEVNEGFFTRKCMDVFAVRP